MSLLKIKNRLYLFKTVDAYFDNIFLSLGTSDGLSAVDACKNHMIVM